MSHEEAYSIIKEASAKQFDPLIVLAFETVEKEFKQLAAELGDDGKSDTGLRHPDDAQSVERLLCTTGPRA